MLPIWAYLAILLACCGYAALWGGGPEKVAAGIMGAGSLLSFAALSAPAARFGGVEAGVLLVDVVVLVAFFALALRAERFWPLWVTALQLIGTAGHVVKLVNPDVIPLAYAFIMALWAYPVLLTVVVATWIHQRRVKRFGADKSWSISSRRSANPHRSGPIG